MPKDEGRRAVHDYNSAPSTLDEEGYDDAAVIIPHRETFENERGRSFTALVDKHYSPLVLRKYTHWGFPIYVSVITDNDLSDLDDVVVPFIKAREKEGWTNDIQKLRNLAGALTEHLVKSYDRTEGVGILFYVDKCFISSLYGDYMNHNSCRAEFYALVNLSPHI